MDSIELGVLWNNLISIANEQAKALRRIAFSPVVREAGDIAVGICDARGRMIANAAIGGPGHINTMRNAGLNMVRAIPPETLQAGDQLITNDPWQAAGHFFDITVLSPIFYKGRLIAFLGSCAHHTDIGGYGMGAGARDIHEEGLWIPPMKLYEGGTPNQTLFSLITHNVREPKHVLGDLAAQVSAGRIAGERICALCERHGIDDLQTVSDELLRRSEETTRNAIRALGSGTYRAKTVFDAAGGIDVTIEAAVAIDADKGEIEIDFAGSSPASPLGINVVLDYTYAYAAFAVRSCLNPEVPNNNGSLTPITIKAPQNCILNAQYPSPVSARHVIGMYVPIPVMKALYQIMPERVIADCPAGIWSAQIFGKQRDGSNFASSMFNYSGGMGARATKDGLSATCYPAGVSAVPIEILEADMPILFMRKELMRGTGGAGRCKGGDGQIISFRMRTDQPWTLNAIVSRTKHESEGLGGGKSGAPGKFLINGKPVFDPRKLTMAPDDEVLFQTPGGGGFGAPPEVEQSERDGESDGSGATEPLRATIGRVGFLSNRIERTD